VTRARLVGRHRDGVRGWHDEVGGRVRRKKWIAGEEVGGHVRGRWEKGSRGGPFFKLGLVLLKN
jgi:hypothetical protein